MVTVNDKENKMLLEVDRLRVDVRTGYGVKTVVNDISFSINRGETLALVGESGSGKTLSARSIMQLLPLAANVAEHSRVSLYVPSGHFELLDISEMSMRRVRGRQIGFIFQEAMAALNPVLTVGQQVREVLVTHRMRVGLEIKARVLELLEQVGISEPVRCAAAYPHQLSGGMKQRAMIALALAAEPALLIADEPTSSLDVTLQKQILSLLRGLQQTMGMGLLFISHDLGAVRQVADHVAVMREGKILEQAPADRFFAEPQADYSRQLLTLLPHWKRKEGQEIAPKIQENTSKIIENDLTSSKKDASGVAVMVPAAASVSPDVTPVISAKAGIHHNHLPLLTIRDLKLYFPIRKGLFKRTVGYVKAVDGVNLQLYPGKTLALVGESGSGKTTAGRAIMQLIKPTEGSVQFREKILTTFSPKALQRIRKDIQMIFQDPYAAMNPRMTIFDILVEGIKAHRLLKPSEYSKRVNELLHLVGLSIDSCDGYPHEFSGGQRQRICIARALAVNPKILICDEITSALDVPIRLQVLTLLKKLQEKFQLAYLFITHDLGLVNYIADEVAVMYQGKIVEQGPVDQIFGSPQHQYTRELLSAVPLV